MYIYMYMYVHVSSCTVDRLLGYQFALHCIVSHPHVHTCMYKYIQAYV